MIFRALDENGDWTFGSGKNNYLSDNAAIGANIKTRLLSWLNDCFFDTNAGIDWLNRLGGRNQLALLELDLRRMIMQSYGVVSLDAFDIVQNGNSVSASYTVTTIFSTKYVDSITAGGVYA